MFSQWAHMGKRKSDNFHENLPSRLRTKPRGSVLPGFFTVITKRSMVEHGKSDGGILIANPPGGSWPPVGRRQSCDVRNGRCSLSSKSGLFRHRSPRPLILQKTGPP